jgi:hypothetical protein
MKDAQEMTQNNNGRVQTFENEIKESQQISMGGQKSSAKGNN